MLKLLKDWRIILVIISIAAAIWMIGISFSPGVVVKSIDASSPFYGKIEVGDQITWANEEDIKTLDDIYKFENSTGVFRFMHSGELELVELDGTGFNMILEEKPSTNIQLGMDLIGGTRVLLSPKENITDEMLDKIVSILEKRVNLYGLKEAKFQSVKDISGNKYAQIEMAGGSITEIEEILSKQGMFEGKISKIVELDDENGMLSLNGENYSVRLSDDKIIIDSKTLDINDTIELEGVKLLYVNSTEDDVVFLASAFSGNDIKSVCLQETTGICAARVMQQGDGYGFMFQVFLSQESADRFAKITKDMKATVNPSTGEGYLNGELYLFLDESPLNVLKISSDLAGRALTDPAITGYEETREAADQEMTLLQSIISSGSLPVELEIVRIEQISPKLGSEFSSSATLAAIVAVFAVACVIFVRYRKLKILVPMLTWSIIELILVLGAAAMLKWTIDLASIAGIIAAIGTGTNDQIVIIDEILLGETSNEKYYGLKQRVKRAFFIIFGAAATVVVAMFPLLIIGIGAMKGFAITTILGLMIGVFITRPAFGKIAEFILKKEE